MSTTWSGDDRRRHPRATVRLPAGVWLEGGEIRPGWVTCVSAGGVRVETRRGLSAEESERLLGQRVWVDFTDVRLAARVARVELGGRVRLGMEFVDPTPTLRERIARLLAG